MATTDPWLVGSTLEDKKMDEIIIKGGMPLKGEVVISGAKNATLPAIAAAVLSEGLTQLHNVPEVRDVRVMIRLLERMGARCNFSDENLRIDTSGMNQTEAPYDLVRKMRASVLLLGPLVARFGKAGISLPGGCAIGNRPIDIHLKALKQMGAHIDLVHGNVEVSATRLKGGDIYLDFPTVTGTENIMMAATKAESKTRIFNAAREPEIANLADMLNKMGADIIGAGTETITINPAGKLHGCDHSIIPDRIEMGTYAIAAIMTGGTIKIKNCCPEHLKAVIVKLKEAGADIDENEDTLVVNAPEIINPVDVQTAVYPGYPTDLQAQFMAMMCISSGESVINETIFENRFMHVAELRRLGADIKVADRTAVVRGVPRLSGAQVMATDLRASASLVLAGLAAEGKTQILKVYHLDRGYDHLVEKIQQLGGVVRRIEGRRL